MKYYLAIDVGTTNWKVTVFDEAGRLSGIRRTPTQTHTDEAGNSYYNPQELWEALQRLCREVTGETGCRISGVSVTSIAEAVVPIDRDGKVLGNIITWYDTRSMEQARQISDLFTPERIYGITGLDVNPIFSLPKILWVREHEPDKFERAYKWLQMADYILYCLTGELVTDYTLASRTMAFDVVENRWSDEILNQVGLCPDIFPDVYESGTVIGRIGTEVSRLTGITNGAKVVVGGNDHPCASIAAGVIHGDKILDSSGTAESYIYISQKGALPKMQFEGQRTCRYLQRDRFALWGGIICSGRSFDWAYETFTSSRCFDIRQESYSMSQILNQLDGEKGMESGIIFYPHMRGAGAPYWNPRISGSFLGLRDIHTAKNMMRAVLEGLSMQARMIVEMEQKLAGVDVKSLCVVGGSSNNIQWQTIKASVTKKCVELCHEAEATALGAAMLAAIGDGVYKSIEEVSDVISTRNEVIYPDDDMVKRYEPLYQLYKEGYNHIEHFDEQIYHMVREGRCHR